MKINDKAHFAPSPRSSPLPVGMWEYSCGLEFRIADDGVSTLLCSAVLQAGFRKKEPDDSGSTKDWCGGFGGSRRATRPPQYDASVFGCARYEEPGKKDKKNPKDLRGIKLWLYGMTSGSPQEDLESAASSPKAWPSLF